MNRFRIELKKSNHFKNPEQNFSTLNFQQGKLDWTLWELCENIVDVSKYDECIMVNGIELHHNQKEKIMRKSIKVNIRNGII
jgi:hypothetical protein